jgi:hypothetical protein
MVTWEIKKFCNPIFVVIRFLQEQLQAFTVANIEILVVCVHCSRKIFRGKKCWLISTLNGEIYFYEQFYRDLHNLTSLRCTKQGGDHLKNLTFARSLTQCNSTKISVVASRFKNGTRSNSLCSVSDRVTRWFSQKAAQNVAHPLLFCTN